MKFSKEKKLHITGGLFYVAAVVFLLLNLLVWNNSKNYKTNFALVALIAFVGIVFTLLGVNERFRNRENEGEKKLINVRMISLMGIMSAISTILYMFVKFPLPVLFPAFLDIQVSEIPALITSFAYGPIAGAIVIVIRCLIKLPFTGTACVGELADLLIGLSLVIPAGIIYKRHKSLKGALASFAISASIATVVALVANWLILIPFYIDFYFGGSINPLLGMMPSFLHINESNYMAVYLFGANLPFNIVRYVLVGVLTFLLYKKIHVLLLRIEEWKNKVIRKMKFEYYNFFCVLLR